MGSLIFTWYDWGVFAGVFLAAAAAIYIFFDSQDLSDPSQVNLPRGAAVLGLLMTFPSLWERLTVPDNIGIFDEIYLLTRPNAELFYWLGILGVLMALGAAVYYYANKPKEADFIDSGATVYVEPLPPVAPTQQPVPAAPLPPVQQPLDPTRPINVEAPASAWLVVRSGARAGQQHGLSMNRPNIIGRDASRADLIVDDPTVSREHARIRYENGQYVLYDLASTSGTFVNGVRMQRQMLYDNDQVTLGQVDLVYKRAA